MDEILSSHCWTMINFQRFEMHTVRIQYINQMKLNVIINNLPLHRKKLYHICPVYARNYFLFCLLLRFINNRSHIHPSSLNVWPSWMNRASLSVFKTVSMRRTWNQLYDQVYIDKYGKTEPLLNPTLLLPIQTTNIVYFFRR